MGYNKKTSITKKHIKNGFIKLLSQHKFDFITVNQIVEEAEITRSTFYRYYEDKYDLLSDIEDEIIEHIHNERQRIDKMYSSLDMLDVEQFKQLFLALEDYSDTIYHLLGQNGDASFEMKLKNEIAKRFVDIGSLPNVSQARINLVKEYLYVILITTFKYWSSHKDKVDVEEIASTLRDVQLKGLRTAIGL